MAGLITARRRAGLAAALGVAALAVLGYAAFEFSGQVTAPRAASQPVSSQQAVAKPLATHPPATPTPIATTAVTATPKPTVAPQTLAAVSAVAFGPHGTADGDNPQIAARVLTDPAMGWVSQWYATPSFGDLKQGTGLLLDLGR
ncbi:MAG TPA: hypothetical protein VGY50_08235, partial [Streptosporangiaceae bacterium]|nr:hypothetical protein [Streptosporangiaceae bacterium]